MINWNTARKTHVEQLYNKNQFVITYNDNGLTYIAFQSYETLICIFCPNTRELIVNWQYFDYSKTTSKHLKIFINEYTCYQYESKTQFVALINNNDLCMFVNR